MARAQVIFFDVGNTLLFPNRSRMLAPIASDRHPTLAEWQARERRTKREFDQGMQRGKIDHSFWWMFHSSLLEDIGENASSRDALLPELVQNTQNSANWDQILPGTCEALERIGQNFRIAIISNADGKIEQVLSRCGIAGCFESITDSGVIGIEKPRREIFEAALGAMKATAEESLYLGDVYSVDYVGAREAGMQAVLFDLAGAYRDREVPRVESLAQFETWLRDELPS
ncbi:MAG: HAD family hydrolase [Candidatus Sulfotelmatobacter sp.]